jgi:hypothetical protein
MEVSPYEPSEYGLESYTDLFMQDNPGMFSKQVQHTKEIEH